MGLEVLSKTPGQHNLDVIICTLSHHGEIQSQTQKCLDKTIRAASKAGLRLGMDRQYGALIPLSRNRGAEKAVDAGAARILFVDSDMVFEDDALLTLWKHDRDIISGLCCARAIPYNPTIKLRRPDGNYAVYPKLEEGRFHSDVDGVGCAFTLIKTSVFEALPQPYFATPAINSRQDYNELLADMGKLMQSYCDSGQTAKTFAGEILAKHDAKPKNRAIVGEDFYFCELAKDHGFDVCVDASVIIGHLGERAYTISDYLDYDKYRKEAEKTGEDTGKALVHDTEAVNVE